MLPSESSVITPGTPFTESVVPTVTTDPPSTLSGVLAEARERGEVVDGADTDELGTILGALTMDAIEVWAARESDDLSLDGVLRFRFGLIVNQFRTKKRRPTAS